MVYNLRDNQKPAVKIGIEILSDKKGRQGLIVAPTAYGKSICIAKIVEGLPKDGKILVLMPNIELLEQNVFKIKALDISISIYSASAGEKDLTEDIIYATPKSLNYEVLKNINIKYVIIDEAEFSTKKGTELSKLLKKLKIKSLLGLTASPIYLEQTLDGSVSRIASSVKGSLFNEIVHVTNIDEMCQLNYWSELKYYDVFDKTKQSLLELNKTGSEYTEESQESFYEACDLKNKIADFLSRLPEGEDALVFVPSIKNVEELVEIIPNSVGVHSKTNKKVRREYTDGFKSGKYKIMINSQCFLAGYDHPNLRNIIDAYPSNSVRVKLQKDGRGCRISEGKDFCRIIDYTNNYKKFGDVRDLNYDYIEDYGWGLFKNDVLITDVPMNSDKIFTKAYLRNGGKINIEYVFDDNNTGTEKLDFGKFSGLTVKFLYYRHRHYLKWLAESDFKFKNKKLEKQIKEIWKY